MWYKRKEFTSGLHFWGRGSPRTQRVMMWLAHNDGLPLGSRDGLAAKVSAWCVSVFQARSQCFAYSATKAHWRVLFSSWPFGSYEQMPGRLEDRVFPRKEQGGIPGPVLGVTGGKTPFKGLVKGRIQRRFAWLFNTGPALYPWWRWRRRVRPVYWAAAQNQPVWAHVMHGHT